MSGPVTLNLQKQIYGWPLANEVAHLAPLNSIEGKIIMHGIIYLVGLVVVVMFILSLLGLS